jgi:hypothetical protein
MVIGIDEASRAPRRCAAVLKRTSAPLQNLQDSARSTDSTPALGDGSTGAMNPLPALNQLDGRMQQPVGGRRDAQRFATPHDEAVQMVDLTALAARQILRGR